MSWRKRSNYGRTIPGDAGWLHRIAVGHVARGKGRLLLRIVENDLSQTRVRDIGGRQSNCVSAAATVVRRDRPVDAVDFRRDCRGKRNGWKKTESDGSGTDGEHVGLEVENCTVLRLGSHNYQTERRYATAIYVHRRTRVLTQEIVV